MVDLTPGARVLWNGADGTVKRVRGERVEVELDNGQTCITTLEVLESHQPPPRVRRGRSILSHEDGA